MALPPNGTEWPPVQLANVLPKLAEYSAWYSNSSADLGTLYGAGKAGFLQRVRDWFVGTKPNPGGARDSIHINLGQEIPRTSANLLFAEAATVTVDDEDAQARLDTIAGPEFEATVVSAAETSSALGGVYFRVNWDRSAASNTFITKVDADMAWPEFRWGRLVAVAFWRTLRDDVGTIVRHLERHELDAAGVGVVYHGLYEGTGTNLGQIVPLTEHPATAGIPVNADGYVSTLTPGLDVVYAPNVSPSALWRHDPIGACLGRSDLEGIEQQLDALDELYSSWLRDIRLGKGRLIVPATMIENLGPGKGTSFDLDQTIFTPVNSAPGSMADSKMQIEHVQFAIRTEDFTKAIDHFRRIIVGAAGFSPSTFGLDTDGGAVTATQVRSEERQSYLTRDRKIRGLKPALEAILTKALAVDAVVFPGQGAKSLPVAVEFADGLQEDPEAIARENQLDYASQSASIKTRVQRAHPDWTVKEIEDEVDAIRDEFGLGALADPDLVGQDGQGLSNGFGEAVENGATTG